MTSTDTTTTAAAPAAATPSIFQEIESKLEAEAQAAVAWFKNGNANVAALLTKVATGAEVFIEDVEAGAQWVGAHLTLINGMIGGLSAVAGAAPSGSSATVTKMLADLQTAANDVAGVSSVLTTGNAAGQPGAVTTAVTAINSVNQLAQLASAAAQTLGTAAAASPSATQTVTAASLSTNA